MSDFNRQGIDLSTIRPGMNIVYQIGRTGTPTTTCVRSVREVRGKVVRVVTDNGVIAKHYILGTFLQYVPPRETKQTPQDVLLLAAGRVGGKTIQYRVKSQDYEEEDGWQACLGDWQFNFVSCEYRIEPQA